MVVEFKDILEAFEFVSFGSMYEHQAFLDTSTGKIYYHSAYGDDLDELPEDRDDKRFIEIPHKNELDLGKKLVLEFAYRYLPDEVGRIQTMFDRKGAYSRYKALLEQKGLLERWYEFESKEQEKALRGWCGANSITVNG
jgi:hypothetical protein